MLRTNVLCSFVNYMVINSSINSIKHSIIKDTNLPSLYLTKNIKVLNDNIKQLYSVEHIYPKSLLSKKNEFDMHNLFRTKNYINNMRSNYKFTDKNDEKLLNNNWIKLESNNYVNKNLKLFIPNEISKGIIARAIMYMAYNFNYNPYKIITPVNLIKWCIDNPPDEKEIYHNKISMMMQHTSNKFIEEYNNLYYINDIKKLF